MRPIQLTKASVAMVCCALLPLSNCEEEGPSRRINRVTSDPSEQPDGGMTPAPDSSTLFNPIDGPVLSCGGLLGDSTCDPVTSWPCDAAADERCGYSNLSQSFRCYSFPTSVPFCGLCDRELNFCGPGTVCGVNHCERYCCQDSDCERGPCVHDIHPGPGLGGVGYCAEDSYAACGSDLGDVMHSDAGTSVDAG
jgi:hypothetical protein